MIPAEAGRSLPPIPPVSAYGTMDGSLFCYSSNRAAFESAPPSQLLPKMKCILLGGLSDGLMPTPYTQDLKQECHKMGWSLVQPILSSSYLGFGHGDLERDTEEISALLWYLCCHREAESFALVGHSTGCQNAVHFCKHGQPEMIERIKVVALQSPVSDREGAMLEPNYDNNIQIAQTMRLDGKENEMMPRSVFWAPITAKRFLDLQEKGGADDFFSSDWTDEDLVERLGHMSLLKEQDLQVLVAFSGADEYVPKHVDSKRLSERLCNAINGGTSTGVAKECFLPNANHNLSESQGDKELFAKAVARCLKNVN